MYLGPHCINAPVTGQAGTPFFVAETLLESGGLDCNEDFLLVRGDTCLVCDGATSLGRFPVADGGGRAAKLTAAAFEDLELSLPARADRANRSILAAMKAAEIDLSRREQLWSTSLAAVRLRDDRLEWLQAGDCMIVLIGEDGSTRLLTVPTNHDIPTLQKWQRLPGSTPGTIQQVLAGEIAAVRCQMNRTYGVLNGEPESLDFLRWGSEPVADVSAILLFSDGLLPPHPEPDTPFDPDRFAALYRQAGLQGIRDRVRQLERRDPECRAYPRFKMHDDISAIALHRSR